MIFLYGAPASGKSTLGRALAERLGLHFVDLDERIVAEAGMTIPEIFKSRGEAVFRDIESKALKEVVSGLISKLQTFNSHCRFPRRRNASARREQIALRRKRDCFLHRHSFRR